MVGSREVREFIVEEIWPAIRHLGFEQFKGRSAWRSHADRVDTLSFVVPSSYEAQRLKLEPGSFAIVLGCHLHYLPNPDAGPRVPPRLTAPSLPLCLFRCDLPFPGRGPAATSHVYWPIGIARHPFAKVMAGARAVVLGKGMKWFEQFRSPASVYKLLASCPASFSRFGLVGGRGSPIRLYMLGHAALAAKKRHAARVHFAQALATGCFDGHARRIRRAAGPP